MPSASTKSAALSAATTPLVSDLSAPPCFFWAWCSQRSAIEKAGRSVCRKCAATLRGVEYPLRVPDADPPDAQSQEPTYTLPPEDLELMEL